MGQSLSRCQDSQHSKGSYDRYHGRSSEGNSSRSSTCGQAATAGSDDANVEVIPASAYLLV
jgi:hypothetical protein